MPQLEAALAETWRTPSGFWGALATVDHKIIGRRYIVTAFVFLALGGVLAVADARCSWRSPKRGSSDPTATTRSSRCTART